MPKISDLIIRIEAAKDQNEAFIRDNMVFLPRLHNAFKHPVGNYELTRLGIELITNCIEIVLHNATIQSLKEQGDEDD